MALTDAYAESHSDTLPGDGLRARALRRGLVQALHEMQEGRPALARDWINHALDADDKALVRQAHREIDQ